MNRTYYFFLILFVVCVLARDTYELFKKAGRVDLENKTLFGLVFSAMIALWISWFTMCPMDPLRIDVPPWLRWIGLGAVVFGLIVTLVAMVQLRGVENINHLVTTGLFSFLRHPMYTGFLLWIVGWAVFHGAILSLMVGALAIASILYWRMLEERALVSQYGETYREYRTRTWF